MQNSYKDSNIIVKLTLAEDHVTELSLYRNFALRIKRRNPIHQLDRLYRSLRVVTQA